ncbi:hypothetical protein AK812_SmicGene20775 [Symbiodinium microadriaticum]|uniref:Uncharacterized protein n=1 Tax=Symbiodinium microadriaticum TaxID=2951 RepID=A0A1Q9DP22_SYMMI|nr:hypothetical protein AK812_SmicGene20775 [Symbiodinium microadriaticum]
MVKACVVKKERGLNVHIVFFYSHGERYSQAGLQNICHTSLHLAEPLRNKRRSVNQLCLHSGDGRDVMSEKQCGNEGAFAVVIIGEHQGTRAAVKLAKVPWTGQLDQVRKDDGVIMELCTALEALLVQHV